MTRDFYYYIFSTSAGDVKVQPGPTGFYDVLFDGDVLGSYKTPEMAIDDVAGGHTFMPSSGVDLGDLGISNDIGDWDKRVFATIAKLRPGRR